MTKIDCPMCKKSVKLYPPNHARVKLNLQYVTDSTSIPSQCSRCKFPFMVYWY
jgi:hypothetical protein